MILKGPYIGHYIAMSIGPYCLLMVCLSKEKLAIQVCDIDGVHIDDVDVAEP